MAMGILSAVRKLFPQAGHLNCLMWRGGPCGLPFMSHSFVGCSIRLPQPGQFGIVFHLTFYSSTIRKSQPANNFKRATTTPMKVRISAMRFLRFIVSSFVRRCSRSFWILRQSIFFTKISWSSIGSSRMSATSDGRLRFNYFIPKVGTMTA